jgi:uncharacterized protein YndB with AHSA1/START domain
MAEKHAGASTRTSRVIKASPEELYAAFMDPATLVAWLPPAEMTGKIHGFDARAGGGYRMSLFYPPDERSFRGKTSDREDRVNVRFVELAPPRRIVEAVTFDGRKTTRPARDCHWNSWLAASNDRERASPAQNFPGNLFCGFGFLTKRNGGKHGLGGVCLKTGIATQVVDAARLGKSARPVLRCKFEYFDSKLHGFVDRFPGGNDARHVGKGHAVIAIRVFVDQCDVVAHLPPSL